MWRSTSHRLWLGAGVAVVLLWACAASFDPARVSGDAGAGGGSATASSSGDLPPDEEPGETNGSVIDPFAENVEYFSSPESAEATSAHAAVDAGSPRAKPDCLSCHGEGAAGATTKFAAGGLTFESRSADGGGGPPCASCEILFVDSVGHRVKVLTAADGTFSVRPEEYGTVSPETHVGIRKGGVATAMTLQEFVEKDGKLRSCNSATCHGPGGAENVIVLTGN